MNEVRVGVIGTGGMGSCHVRRFENGNVRRARITAVCDIEPCQMKKFDGKYKTFTDSRELIRSGEVDAVVIATPHYFHTTIGIDALSNGIHTLTEKPISVHKADAERLIAAHTDPNVVFAAMFNQRTDPHFIKLRDLIVSGELGAISRISWVITDWFRTQHYYDGGGWRATWAGEGGGVLLNQCPHQLDLLQWLFGMPSKVRAFCEFGKYHDIEVEDAVTAYLQYQSGATGTFITTTGEAPGTNRLEIAADRGRVILENGKLTWDRNVIGGHEFIRESHESFAKPETWNVDIPVNGFGGQHDAVMQNFIDAILDGVPLIAPAEQGINSVELCNAMLYSSFMDKTIELPLKPSEYEANLQKLIKASKYVKRTIDTLGHDVDMSASSSAFKK